MSATATPLTQESAETKLFRAFCDRCGRNPLDWSTQTRRQFRKAIRRCRKCGHQDGAR